MWDEFSFASFFFFFLSETFSSICLWISWPSSLTVWLIVIISYPAGMGECSDVASELRILIWWLNVSLTGPIYNRLIL